MKAVDWDSLVAIVGAKYILTGDDTQSYVEDWRKQYVGKALAVVKPANVNEVAEIVKWCVVNKVAIVPQGGNTGLCGGATPDDSGLQMIVSLTRLKQVRQIDATNNTLTVEAGCTLYEVQQLALSVERYFPLSLAAEGTCTIGGNLSTNAGGTAVLRYGNTRDLTLGLEVVTPQGEILSMLRGLRKDNTGYDLKHLFIGAEGSLGLITAATLKLFPKPQARLCALTALETPEQCLNLLNLARDDCDANLTAFEVISHECLGLVVQHVAGTQNPFNAVHAWYALIEISNPYSEEKAREQLEGLLEQALENDVIQDAVCAQSLAQVQALWRLRESISEAESKEGRNIKHDVSIPISSLPDFMKITDAQILTQFPGTKMVVFGHFGDGNLHYNVSCSHIKNLDDWREMMPKISHVVHESVAAFNGSISAEHGLGQFKAKTINLYKSELEMRLMRQIKAVLDPHNIMNPGKVIA